MPMRIIILVAVLLPALAAAFLPPPHMGTTAPQLPPRAAAKTRRFINSDGPVTDVDVAGKLDPSRYVDWDRAFGKGLIGSSVRGLCSVAGA